MKDFEEYKGMKKLILLALTAVMMVGCEETKKPSPTLYRNKKTGTITTIIDNCEYIVNKEKYSFSYTEHEYITYTHKGNCRFCKERRQKELEELVTKLKEK